MQRLKSIKADAFLLATTDDAINTFKPLADEAGFQSFSGSKEDVLGRFCNAYLTMQKRHEITPLPLREGLGEGAPDYIIRATGDNPFVIIDAANRIADEAIAQNADYACYQEIPYGSGVEIIKAEALLRANREATEPFEREHVCPYLYNHPELFKLYRPIAPAQWRHPEIRLTVDTEADYKRALELYSKESED
jgi:spore coat polysaccharide biosynthesis protein SpsF